MSVSYLNKIYEDLQTAVRKKNHPYVLCTLGTVGLDSMARLRTIVLRDVFEDKDLLFYTDRRSKKVTHLKENKMLALLFYHPVQKIQVKIEGTGQIIRDKEQLGTYWDQIAKENRKDYTSSAPPGSVVSAPDDVEYLKDRDYFCAIRVTPFKIEYLQLQPVSHIKVRYSKKEGNWISEFLVP